MVAQEPELGGSAIVGVDIDYETLQVGGGGMLMVSASGTAVRLKSLTSGVGKGCHLAMYGRGSL